MKPLFVFLISVVIFGAAAVERKKLAIVGAGMGGAASAYFMKKSTIGSEVDIVMFEKEDRVGGRTFHLELEGNVIEIGASVYYVKNYNVRNFTLDFNFTEVGQGGGESIFALWNGKEVLIELGGSSIVNTFKMLWRYGLSPLYSQREADKVRDLWQVIYTYVTSGVGFSSIGDFLRGLYGVDIPTTTSTRTLLETSGVKDLFIDEFVAAVTRINYGQDSQLNGFAGMISLIGSGDDLYAPKQGLSTVCKAVINYSGADLRLETPVVSFDALPNGQYLVTSNSKDGLKQEVFDGVIIASPLEFAGVSFGNISVPARTYIKRQFQVTHVTIVVGQFNYTYFGKVKSSIDSITVATIEDPSIPFTSISFRAKLSKGNAYKVFSRQRTTDELLSQLFYDISYVYRKEWHAYPILNATDDFPPVILSDRFYYLNAIESSASVMEISTVAGENAVNLLVQDWTTPSKREKDGKKDEKKNHKDEL